MPPLYVESLSAGYGDFCVLWDVSVFHAGAEIVSIVGANGAGKTTLLKVISGFIRPRSGTVRFGDISLAGLPPKKIVELGIVHVPEGRHLFNFMSVEENLFLGAFTERAQRRMRTSLEWVFDLFPVLQQRRRQLAGTLSGGEQQMLAVGRGIMAAPELLLLDEPSVGVAPLMLQRILHAVELLKEQGVGVLLVEQNVHHALPLSQHAFVLESGRITMAGGGADLLQNSYLRQAYLGL